MKYRLFTTSQRAWDGMFKAMLKAQTSIYLEMYIFLNDTKQTHDFFRLLKEKVQSGVEVVIIADSYGSSSLPAEEIKALRDAGAEFIFFSHWLKRTHRKILIVDNKTAFLGGVNINEKNRYWRDLQIQISGGAVKLALKSFANSYRRCGGKKESILRLSKTPLSKRIKYWVIDNWPSTNKPFYLNSYYRQKIAEAQNLIQIVTPYLLPPRWMIAALDDACRRGVKIEMIIPKDTDVKPLNKVNFINACRLAQLGVQFFMTKTMNHAKIMLIDKTEVLVGSQNIDLLSFNWNFEAGIFSRQAKLVADLSNIVEDWKKEADPFIGQDNKLGLKDRALVSFYKFFYPIF